MIKVEMTISVKSTLSLNKDDEMIYLIIHKTFSFLSLYTKTSITGTCSDEKEAIIQCLKIQNDINIRESLKSLFGKIFLSESVHIEKMPIENQKG